MAYRENAEILKAGCLADGVYEIWFETKNIAKEAKAGQFISVYSNDGSRLLPRPISIAVPTTANSTFMASFSCITSLRPRRMFQSIQLKEHTATPTVSSMKQIRFMESSFIIFASIKWAAKSRRICTPCIRMACTVVEFPSRPASR